MLIKKVYIVVRLSNQNILAVFTNKRKAKKFLSDLKLNDCTIYEFDNNNGEYSNAM